MKIQARFEKRNRSIYCTYAYTKDYRKTNFIWKTLNDKKNFVVSPHPDDETLGVAEI